MGIMGGNIIDQMCVNKKEGQRPEMMLKVYSFCWFHHIDREDRGHAGFIHMILFLLIVTTPRQYGLRPTTKHVSLDWLIAPFNFTSLEAASLAHHKEECTGNRVSCVKVLHTVKDMNFLLTL